MKIKHAIFFIVAMCLFSNCRKWELEEVAAISTDACAEVTCLNGGTCSNGVCDCPEGYTGDNCGIEPDNPNTSGLGQITVWTDFEGPDIKVYIDGSYKGKITNDKSSVPSCGASGCVTVSLDADIDYDLTAEQDGGNLSWTFSGSVSAGECEPVRLYTSKSLTKMRPENVKITKSSASKPSGSSWDTSSDYFYDDDNSRPDWKIKFTRDDDLDCNIDNDEYQVQTCYSGNMYASSTHTFNGTYNATVGNCEGDFPIMSLNQKWQITLYDEDDGLDDFGGGACIVPANYTFSKMLTFENSASYDYDYGFELDVIWIWE